RERRSEADSPRCAGKAPPDPKKPMLEVQGVAIVTRTLRDLHICGSEGRRESEGLRRNSDHPMNDVGNPPIPWVDSGPGEGNGGTRGRVEGAMDIERLHDRWNVLCSRIGAFDHAGDGDMTFDLLASLYATPAREYHNLEHIASCLAAFDAVRMLAEER